MRYELHFVDERGKLLATDVVEADNDNGAVDAARRKYPAVLNVHYKICQGDRFVTMASRTEPQLTRHVPMSRVPD